MTQYFFRNIFSLTNSEQASQGEYIFDLIFYYYYYYSLKKQLILLRTQNSQFKTINKSEELWKVRSRVQSITSNSLTIPSMQQSRMKSHKTGPPKQHEGAYLSLPIY